MLYAAWRFGGHDPYRLYNRLDELYRPVGSPTAEPCPPPRPRALRNFIYGCGFVADQESQMLAVSSISG